MNLGFKSQADLNWLYDLTQHSKSEDHGIWSHHFIANRRGKSGSSDRFYFLGLHNHYGQLTVAMKIKDVCVLEEEL